MGAGGQKASVGARVAKVDNARETVDENGRIHGDRGIRDRHGAAGSGHLETCPEISGTGDILGAAKGAVVKEVDPSIHYEPGIEMTLELTRPLQWNETATGPKVRAIGAVERLAELVNREPLRTTAQKATVAFGHDDHDYHREPGAD